MPFATERAAKEFLANKIYQQSQFTGAPLSDLDRRLLLFSEQDPGSEQGIPDDVLYADTDPDWERRMTGLLRDAWQREQHNAEERQIYLDAMDRLKAGDHYILVIAGPVFGGPLGNPNLFAFPVISLKRIALWSAVGIVVFVIVALVCVALTR